MAATRTRPTPAKREFDKAYGAAHVASLRAWDASEASSRYAPGLHRAAYDANIHAAKIADKCGYAEIAVARREAAQRHLEELR